MASLDDLAREVRGFVADTGAGASPPDDEAFGRLALRVFAMQFEHNRPYRAFCERRGVQPDRIDGWSAIPAVPTSAFRSLDLGCAPTETVFLTSGTTGGTERRGRHPVPRPEVYREAAIALGTPTWKIMFGHILPNCVAPLIVQGTFICASGILVEAILSFLGVGLPPDIPTWGNIMAEGRAQFVSLPHNVFFPGVFLAVTVLAVNILGDGLRDTLDPKMAKRV